MEHRPKGAPSEHVASVRELATGPGDLAHDSAGQVQPRYQFVQRPAGRLACGELVVEPALGPVRATSVEIEARGGRSPFVHVAWRDDHGPCRAAGRYPAERLFPVRAPHSDDVLLVRRGIDQAVRNRRDVSDSVARLIAAHLHFGPRSALYSFAVRGRVWEDLYEELDAVATERTAYRPWVTALARYCLSREDTGPVSGWGMTPPEPAVDQPDAAPVTGRQRGKAAKPRPSNAKRMSIETALRLMDAAYALGVAASRPDSSVIAARKLIELRDPAAL